MCLIQVKLDFILVVSKGKGVGWEEISFSKKNLDEISFNSTSGKLENYLSQWNIHLLEKLFSQSNTILSMNPWIKKSIELANAPGYMDSIIEVIQPIQVNVDLLLMKLRKS